MSWVLGIDVGTSFTVAAVRNGDRAEILEIDGRRRFSSAVLALDDGSLLVGDEAERRAPSAPDRIERAPKRYLDVGQPGIPLGDRLVPVHEAIGRLVHVVWEEALRQHSGVPPEQTRMTHPATWGESRRQLLTAAATSAGLGDVGLISEPEAAAAYLSRPRVAGEPVAQDGCVAVYDLGGGTFDMTVLRREGDRFVMVGEPRGDDRVGGDLFDERLYRWLGEHALPPDVWSELLQSDARDWRYANHEFRRAVTAAKEAVSKSPTCPVYIPAPVDLELQVTREELEELIRPDVDVTLDLLDETLTAAGQRPSDLAALFLVGGSSRIPMIGALLRERFGRADFKGDPKGVVALGAAQTEASIAAMAEVTAPLPKAAPLRTGSKRSGAYRDALARDPRRELVLDLVDELVAHARHGVQRVLVLRHAALLESHGIGAEMLLEYAQAVAEDFLVLRAGGKSDGKPEAWSGLRTLVAPAEPLAPRIAAKLPWSRSVTGWSGVVHPLEARRERRAADGKAKKARQDQGREVHRLLNAASKVQPVLCLLDDVPHLDGPSIEALRYLTRDLLGSSEEQAPERTLVVLTGGRRGDPVIGPGTSLQPNIKLPRRQRDQLLYMHPFQVHQNLAAPTPSALEGDDRATVSRFPYGVL